MTCDHKWRPFADNAIARSRAELYSSIRLFMSDRHILEVDTPILSRHGISDPFIDSIRAEAPLAGLSPLYLHTSPEFCMKRLLASGIGDCYQIAHVFRDGEKGKRHTLEFVMLEWYRLRFDYHKLIDELGELLAFLGLDKPSKKPIQIYSSKHLILILFLSKSNSSGHWQKMLVGIMPVTNDIVY